MIDIVTNNVKQIGTPADEGRVYINEKAYKKIKQQKYADNSVYILMGHTESSNNKYATFVEAAIEVNDIEFERNIPMWTNKIWSKVFNEIKREYENQIIVGWAMERKGFMAEPNELIERIHQENFGGAHQLLFMINQQENEEYFYVRKNSRLKQKSGFFVYYTIEKNQLKNVDEEAPFDFERDNEYEKVNVDISNEVILHRGKYRKMMEQQDLHETDRGNGIGSVIAVGAIAAIIIAISISFKDEILKLIDKEEAVTVMSTEQELIPVEKISGECYTDNN